MTSISDTRALDAWSAYRRLRLSLDAEVARDLERDCGLSMPDYDVLAATSELSDGEHCIRVRDLATHLGWAHSRLSRQLGRMEGRGLIAREKCELDGRGEDVVLTGEGRQALARAAPVHAASVRHRFAELLTSEQLSALVDIANRLAPPGTGSFRTGTP
ncbi:MarR family winged helix-turn-helix transcriptional regulator [Sinosporangium siamense]|uniref:MarR family transcriptional regulator n=1 Tax=Sinosporangium siamense TaxID=1367973 RepID=A0A919V5P6_9ACTN|nr:MarR family winged helix-turn-helix transcriptional regulator [Sinosporangium siamense]GII90137.1 MarR family transcriptional regulator [Sinosporangium siamense]